MSKRHLTHAWDITNKCWYSPTWADKPISVLAIDLDRRDIWRKSAWTSADNIKHQERKPPGSILETLQSYLEGKNSDGS